MAQPTAMLDFFVLEASDYLERLDALAQTRADAVLPGEEFVRLARAFRGSALMANQQVMARAAQGLEAVARASRDGRLEWSERVRADVVRAVDDCKVLLRRVKNPEAGDAQRAEALGLGLERLAGRSSGVARTHVEGLDAGGRAFVGREAAAIASTLDQVARTLAMDPSGRDVLHGIAPAMSQLRGVAILNDLPPLADVLAAIDGAVRLVHGLVGPVPADTAAVFDFAAKALARSAREVVESGRPTPSSDEARAFTAALLRTFVTVGDPVPIELLYPADGSGLVVAGTAPAEGAGPSRVELVSQGEFLAATAADLGRATSEVQRDLRLFVIGSSLKPLIASSGSALARALAAFAEAGWWAIGLGAAAAEPERFVEVVSDAAATLRATEAGDEPRIAQLLYAHASRLLLRLPYPPPSVPLAPAPIHPVAAPLASAVAPLAPPAPPAPVATPAAPARPAAPVPLPPDRPTAIRPLPRTVPAEGGGLAASWSTLEALIGERGVTPGTLEELIAGTPAGARSTAPRRAVPDEQPVVPIEDLAPDEAEVVPVERLAPDEADVVPIESLLYDHQSARQRLREVRGELDSALATAGTAPQVRSLLGEVFDLIDLGFLAPR